MNTGMRKHVDRDDESLSGSMDDVGGGDDELRKHKRDRRQSEADVYDKVKKKEVNKPIKLSTIASKVVQGKKRVPYDDTPGLSNPPTPAAYGGEYSHANQSIDGTSRAKGRKKEDVMYVSVVLSFSLQCTFTRTKFTV